MPKTGMTVQKFRINKKTGRKTKVGKPKRAKLKRITEEDFFGDMKPMSRKLKVDFRKRKRKVSKYGKELGMK